MLIYNISLEYRILLTTVRIAVEILKNVIKPEIKITILLFYTTYQSFYQESIKILQLLDLH